MSEQDGLAASEQTNGEAQENDPPVNHPGKVGEEKATGPTDDGVEGDAPLTGPGTETGGGGGGVSPGNAAPLTGPGNETAGGGGA
jgi:hypothetical protein